MLIKINNNNYSIILNIYNMNKVFSDVNCYCFNVRHDLLYYYTISIYINIKEKK